VTSKAQMYRQDKKLFSAVAWYKFSNPVQIQFSYKIDFEA
jgi:hypothetical protein